MPFERPTLSELRQRVAADFDTNIPDADSQLPINLPSIDATVHAGATHSLHGAIESQSKRILPIHDDEETILAWAEVKKLQRLPASFATGDVLHTNATDGVVIPTDARYQSGSGEIYIVQADATVANGEVNATITAENAGSAGNLPAGSNLTLVAPIAGVPAQATVGINGIQGGAEQETIAALQERVLFEFQRPPRGGSSDDYIRWAKAAHPSVTRVFVSPHERGNGTIVVRFTTDNEASIIPAPQIVQAVNDYILPRSPADARNIYIEAPTPQQRNFNFTELVPNTAAVRAAIEAELQDLYRRFPVPGTVVPDSKISEAVSVADGEEQHQFTASNTPLSVGDIEIIGAITWPPVV